MGWRIVARNVRVGDVRGEIDLIAVDGRALVFVEVKACRVGVAGRSGDAGRWPSVGESAPSSEGSPPRGCVSAATTSPRHRDLRFDVVGLRVDASGRVTEYQHLRAAFSSAQMATDRSELGE